MGQTNNVIYEWDPKKAKANLRKHGVSFENAATVFLDPSDKHLGINEYIGWQEVTRLLNCKIR